jgi:hypothetical protein
MIHLPVKISVNIFTVQVHSASLELSDLLGAVSLHGHLWGFAIHHHPHQTCSRYRGSLTVIELPFYVSVNSLAPETLGGQVQLLRCQELSNVVTWMISLFSIGFCIKEECFTLFLCCSPLKRCIFIRLCTSKSPRVISLFIYSYVHTLFGPFLPSFSPWPLQTYLLKYFFSYSPTSSRK